MKTKRLHTLFIMIGALSLVSLIVWIFKTAQDDTVLQETSMQDFESGDFDALHSPVNGDTNTHLIFGNLPVSEPAPDLQPELAAYLGRWEGYSYAAPVQKDWKIVLVIQEITEQDGKAFLWMGTNLQYPSEVKEIHFRVVPGGDPTIEWEFEDDFYLTGMYLFVIDPDTGLLQGGRNSTRDRGTWGPIVLSRDRSFTVYKDYAQYLAGLRIVPKEYRDDTLTTFYGDGYLLYLPEGYEADTQQTWPLIIFLHGYGDRGDNLLLLAKASPFMMIREQGPLPFIIAAPLLKASDDFASFPDNYLNGVLDELLADYRVDQKRIYVTGLSMGGEATYRFALLQPDRFAAIAPLAAYLDSELPMESIKDVPVWAIHGAEDKVVPLSMAEKPVKALEKVGGNIQFTVLEDHDHDVWTDTYSDPEFYDWLLQHEKP